jgi:hypothetical protein
MESEEELVQHVVEIDNYTEVTLKIPKRLSVMALKGLLTKANKMFNIAEVPIEAPMRRRRNGGSNKLPPEAVEMLMKAKKNHTPFAKMCEKLKAEFGIVLSVEQLRRKVYYLQHNV